MTTTEDIMEGLNKVIIKYTFILIPPFTTEILTHVEFISNLKKKKKKNQKLPKQDLVLIAIMSKNVFVKN